MNIEHRTQHLPSNSAALCKRRNRALTASIIFAFTLGCFGWQPRADQPVAGGITSTSIVRLIAHPELYDGKRVEVIGYYATGQELHALFLSKESAAAGDTESSVWLDVPTETTNKLVDIKLKSGSVIVDGTFHYDRKKSAGHMGMWTAQIAEISLLQSRK